jgi:hypothetical protein
VGHGSTGCRRSCACGVRRCSPAVRRCSPAVRLAWLWCGGLACLSRAQLRHDIAHLHWMQYENFVAPQSTVPDTARQPSTLIITHYMRSVACAYEGLQHIGLDAPTCLAAAARARCCRRRCWPLLRCRHPHRQPPSRRRCGRRQPSRHQHRTARRWRTPAAGAPTALLESAAAAAAGAELRRRVPPPPAGHHGHCRSWTIAMVINTTLWG